MMIKSDVIEIKGDKYVEITSTFSYQEIELLGEEFIRAYGGVTNIPTKLFPKFIGHMIMKASDLSDDIINIQGLGGQ